MELKTKYQYTYFIYPYMIREQKMKKYLLKLIRDKNCELRFFEKEKDFDIYNYFLPNIREYLFKTFEFTNKKVKKFKEFSDKMQSNILAQYPCNIFEYQLGEDIQGRIIDKEGIFFKIQKIEIICFQTGICFIAIKTNVEDTNVFSDILNFNYRFRDIHSELEALKNYENIKIQTNKFNNMRELSDLIRDITGNTNKIQELDIDNNKFLTYSYACLEQEYWNDTNDFTQIENEFFKYANVLPSRYNSSIDRRGLTVVSKSSYVKMGFNQLGTSLITSSVDSTSYTKLPFTYENQYLYNYILGLYKKIYLKKLSKEFDHSKQIEQTRKKFIEFTRGIWVKEITDDSYGNILCQNWRKVLKLTSLYNDVKNQFDLLYKESKVEKVQKLNKGIMIALCVSLVINVVNFIALFILRK